MIPWNRDVILWNRGVIPWNHVVILVFAARSLDFSWQGEAFILGPILQSIPFPQRFPTLILRRTHVAVSSDVSAFSTLVRRPF